MGLFGALKQAASIARLLPIPGAQYAHIAIEGIGLVEEAVGSGKGSLKKSLAKKLIKESIKAYEGMQGRDVVDEDKLMQNLDGLIDVLVELSNEFGLWERLLGGRARK